MQASMGSMANTVRPFMTRSLSPVIIARSQSTYLSPDSTRLQIRRNFPIEKFLVGRAGTQAIRNPWSDPQN